MFRQMRRFKQQLTDVGVKEILKNCLLERHTPCGQDLVLLGRLF